VPEPVKLLPMMTAAEEAALLDFALAKLWEGASEGEHCCPQCCVACNVIESIIGSGRANVLLRAHVEMAGDARFLDSDELDEEWIMAAWNWPGHECEGRHAMKEDDATH
jgi:hypothetical protein